MWTHLRNYLEKRLAGKLTSSSIIVDWLDSIHSSDYEEDLKDKTFILNLSIDIECGYLDADYVRKIIISLPRPFSNGRVSCGNFIYLHKDTYICKNQNGPQILNTDNYFRVLTLRSFIKYFAGKDKALLYQNNKKDRQRVLNKYFDPPSGQHKKALGSINARWSGFMNNVFVQPVSEYNSIILNGDGNEAFKIGVACGFNNKLNKIDYILMVKYPDNYADIEFFKPTVLDAHYEIHPCFLNYDSNSGWGHTCATHDFSPGIRERVHKYLNKLTDDFVGINLGKPSHLISFDDSHFINVAQARLNRCFNSDKKGNRLKSK